MALGLRLKATYLSTGGLNGHGLCCLTFSISAIMLNPTSGVSYNSWNFSQGYVISKREFFNVPYAGPTVFNFLFNGDD